MAAAPRSFALPLRRRASIPSYDVAQLRGPIRRTAILRLLLGGGLVAMLALAVLAARRPTARAAPFLTGGKSVILVLDLSRSIDDLSYRLIRSTLQQVVATGTPAGLIAFSDTAYELVPPGSRASALTPMIRLFTRRAGAPRAIGLFAYPRSPWGDNFRGGTRISTGLTLARQILRRDHVQNANVVLISDLESAASDNAPLTGELVRYRIDKIPLKLVALFPSLPARQLFGRLVGREAFVKPQDVFVAGRRLEARPVVGSRAPWLIVASIVLLALLGANEWLFRRLEVPRA